MITRQLFDRLFPTKGLDPKKYNLVRQRDQLVDALNRILPKYGIDNYLRICAFFGNCGIETDYFKTTIEYASGTDYEGRKDLGNTRAGDGKRFKGRGLSQTTGRDNYEALQEAIGDELGIDVVKNPELLAEIDVAVESACVFWRDHDLNSYADKGDFRSLSGIVNRGKAKLMPLQWPKRNELYSKCRRYLPQDLSLADDLSDKSDNLSTPDLLANKQPQGIQQLADIQPAQDPQQTNEPAADDNFLADAIDKNVSPDEIRGLAREHSPRLIIQLARPIGYIWAALEAGNVYAWFGIALAAVFIGFELYLHRAKIRKAFEKLKAKITQ
jgi:predicted chitinase